MISLIIFIVIVAAAVSYLIFGVQKHKKEQAELGKVEELKLKTTIPLKQKNSEVVKPKATQNTKSKPAVKKQNKTK